jgi:hypothetical protein
MVAWLVRQKVPLLERLLGWRAHRLARLKGNRFVNSKENWLVNKKEQREPMSS